MLSMVTHTHGWIRGLQIQPDRRLKDKLDKKKHKNLLNILYSSSSSNLLSGTPDH